MIYSVILSDNAFRQFNKLERKVQERITTVLDRIRIRPFSYVNKLVGKPGYKIRVGDYRIVMDIEQQKLLILVIQIGHRRNIYDRSITPA